VLNGIIKILLYIIGFSLAVFAVLYATVLSMVDLLPENLHKVVLVGIISITVLLIARRISKKQG
jgi:hypothetical protein